jgi:hypothetical protein
MGDAATMYETREAIEAQIAQARRMRGSDRPALAAFSPMALYVAIAVAVVVGAAMNVTSGGAPDEKPSTVAQLAKAQ